MGLSDRIAHGSDKSLRVQPILRSLGDVSRQDSSVFINENMGGNRDVATIETTPFVAQPIRADHHPLGVAEDRKTEALVSGQTARVLPRIDRYRQQPDAKLIEFLVYRSETSEFGLAQHSPKAPEEDQQDGAGCACLVKRDSLAPVIHKGEIRRYFQLSEARCRR